MSGIGPTLVVQIKQIVPVPTSSSPPLNTGARAASLVTAAPGCSLFCGYDAEARVSSVRAVPLGFEIPYSVRLAGFAVGCFMVVWPGAIYFFDLIGRSPRRKKIAIWGMSICGIGFLGFTSTYFWPERAT